MEEREINFVTRYHMSPIEKSNYGGHYGEEYYTICELEVTEHPRGEWVKYEDIRWMIQRIQDD